MKNFVFIFLTIFVASSTSIACPDLSGVYQYYFEGTPVVLTLTKSNDITFHFEYDFPENDSEDQSFTSVANGIETTENVDPDFFKSTISMAKCIDETLEDNLSGIFHDGEKMTQQNIYSLENHDLKVISHAIYISVDGKKTVEESVNIYKKLQ